MIDQREVFMVQPFTSKDLVIRKLADRISDLKHLLFLYPDVPKDVVFGKYYTPFTDNQQPTNGYVKPSLVTHLPGYNINDYCKNKLIFYSYIFPSFNY